MWEAQIREIDENNNITVSNLSQLFQPETPKLRPRFTFPIGDRRVEVIRDMELSMQNFLQNLEAGNLNMSDHTYLGENLPSQQAKIAGRTAICNTLYRLWRLLEQEITTGQTANLAKVKIIYFNIKIVDLNLFNKNFRIYFQIWFLVKNSATFIPLGQFSTSQSVGNQ